MAGRGSAEEGGRGVGRGVAADGGSVAVAASPPTVLPGCWTGRAAAPREQVPARIRARILALTRTSPPAETGLSHWSSREMAAFIERTEGVYVSHHYVAKLWRETGSEAAPAGHVQGQQGPGVRREGRRRRRAVPGSAGRRGGALDRREDADPGAGPDPAGAADRVRRDRETHPRLRPARHHEPVRRAERRPPARCSASASPPATARTSWPSCKKAVKPHAGKDDPRRAGQPVHPHHPRGHGLAGRATRTCTSTSPRSGRRGSTRSRPGSASSPASPSAAARSPRVTVLIKQIRDYIDHWNTDSETVRLDRHRRRDPRQGPTRPDQHQETRRQQRQVKHNRITRH